MKVILFLTLALSGGWTEPIEIAEGSNSDLVLDRNGVCWCNPSSWFLYSFNNETSTWQFEIEAPSPGTPLFDSDGTLWMFNGFTYIRWDGQVWSEVETVPAYPSANFNTNITADSSDGIWVGWETDWWGAQQVVYNRYLNGTWGDPGPVSDTLISTDDKDIRSMTTDAEGRVWFVWRNIWDPEYDDGDVLKAKYNDDGVWSEESVLYVHDYEQDTIFPLCPHLAPDRDGGVWAVWCGHDAGSIFMYYIQVQYWDGESWSELETIAEAGVFDIFGNPEVRIAVDNLGYVWVVWRQALVPRDAYCDIYYSVNTGEGWSEPAPIDDDPGADGDPEIVVDYMGRVWCVWGSTRGGEAGTWASYYWSTGVEEPAPVTPATHLPVLTVERSLGSSFTFHVSNPAKSTEIQIYDAAGRNVRNLEINTDVLTWDGTDNIDEMLSAGVYFVRIDGTRTNASERIVLIR